mmetsp:Transcript_8563/g.18381  ORF Transcript_8563/g.18381 Transcript_8563/m.18381 type:complete len:229 (-) Transcript_8563:199-885(-)|eukprot:CAMPEP_0171333294 /NCGR_PEP_ID=MMETSP0878-20121228/3939_1 /TAXON_ID=67004 /ORGANISM="Thalassiosira weissflogii, Strain CCMP1336" /LENGTH=228 /DNA_ID=CAMNT_0011834233 /DNA_START=157 /DNA_END=843 /DNA_ORIENTATION=-
MEVVSPLNFPHSNQNGKRRFACSPIRDASSTNVANVLDSSDDFEMDDSAGFGFQASKRRRKLSNDVGVDSRSQWAVSSFASATFSGRLSPNSSVASSKRIRDSHSDINGAFQRKLDELQQLIGQQASEIERNKTEKEVAQASAAELSAQNDKVEHENKILKRAVTIQQERQNQMSSELEAARRFRVEAEDRIRRLEQVNLTLQYQLQAANSSSGNDFMGFSPRPPDVY